MTSFSLLIKPASADCNLRCRYCFYLPKADLYPNSPIHRMSYSTLERLVSSYMSTNQEQYTFVWQGGEPTLMGLGFFEKVIELQKEYGKDNAIVSNILQTNATLINDSWAAFLSIYHFLVGVSLDGPPELHDKNRVYAEGKGSHSHVLKGIECLRRYDVPFNILVLVSASNVKLGREIYRYLRSNNFFFHQYIPCVDFDETSEGMPSGHTISGKQWGDFICGVFDEWLINDIDKVSVRLFDSILNAIMTGQKTVCAMNRSCNSYFVVEYNGDVYPCDFFVEPDYQVGNIAQNRWHEMQTAPEYLRFAERKSKWNQLCDVCSYLEFCAGDCIKYRIHEHCNPRTLSRLCNGWKAFYGHALGKLEDIAVSIIHKRHTEWMTTPDAVNTFSPSLNPKTGRNEPCPCGSGLKYKKCCGR